METLIIAEGLRLWRKLRGLYVRGVTSCPTYLKGKEEIFNLRRVPRNATDKKDLARSPTPLATIKLKDSCEGVSRAL